jgi:hypothetical protein
LDCWKKRRITNRWTSILSSADEQDKCKHEWERTKAIYHDKAPFILTVYECQKCRKEIEKWELKDKDKQKEILEAEYDYDYYKQQPKNEDLV